MPSLTQTSYLCSICSQRFYALPELEKHYNSSHGNVKDFPTNGEEGWEDNTGWDGDDAFYGIVADLGREEIPVKTERMDDV